MCVGCEVDQEGFRLPKKAMLKNFAKAAVHSAMDAELSGDSTEAVVVILSLVPQVTVADLLCILPDELPLYFCLSLGVPALFRTLCQSAEFALLPVERLVDCWCRAYLSRMRQAIVQRLHIAEACACSVVTASARIR